MVPFFKTQRHKSRKRDSVLDTIFSGFYRIVKWLGLGNPYSLHPNPVKTSQFCVLKNKIS